MSRTISIIGLGKVGSAMAATYASKNMEVYGYDIDLETINCLRKSRALIPESNVDQLLEENSDHIFLINSISEAVEKTDFTFVILPTPSDDQNRFTNTFLINACTEIAQTIAKKKEYHTICISSTVMPETIRTQIIPLFERISGKTEGKDFGVAYSPEFIALGNIVYNLVNPDLVLIGNSNERTFNKVLQIKKLILNTNKVISLSFDEAEIVKLSINCFITMKISFANMIGELVDKGSSADKFKILESVGTDSRIGQKFISPGLGYGGPCFPRDNKALARYAKDNGVESVLTLATDEINNRQSQIYVDKIISLISNKIGSILFLGITYKEGTSSIEESQVLKIAKTLKDLGNSVHFHDFNFINLSMTEFDDFQRIFDLEFADLGNFDLIVFSQRDKRYVDMYSTIKDKGFRVLDIWGQLNVK